MENSRSFKRDFSKKSYSELCGILFSKSFANEVLGSDTDGFSEPAATKLLSTRMQAILNSLKEKKIKVDDVDKTVDDMVKLFKAEAFSNAAANYSKEELLKYCVKTKAWNDAVQYARKTGNAAVEHEADIINFLTSELTYCHKSILDSFEEWHRSIMTNSREGVKEEWGMTPGLWQKLINMTFKYLYCVRELFPEFDGIWKLCHCPIDSIILTRLYNVLKDENMYNKELPEHILVKAYANREHNANWNNLTIEDYSSLQGVIRTLGAKDGITPLQFDFIYW